MNDGGADATIPEPEAVEPTGRTDREARRPAGALHRPRVMFLSSCVHGGGVGRSLAAYLERAVGEIEPIVVMPERGVIAERLPEEVDLRLVPELVERPQRGPYRLPNRLGWRSAAYAGGIAAMFHAAARITRLVRELRPDVIYANHMIAKPIAAVAGWRTGTPTVLHARNVHVHPVGRAFYRGVARLPAASMVIANSGASAAPYRGTTEIEVVPNFVDLETFDPARVEPSLRAELGLSADTRVVGYLGRLVPKKGLDVLLRAFARVRPQHPDAVLALVGGNDHGQFRDMERHYRELAEELGVADAVYFVGFRDRVAPLVADFDVHVLPSIEPESFGRVLIESMALGVPSVTSAHGGATEVVQHGDNGLWAPPGDADGLAEQLDRILGDDAFRRRLGERGFRDVHRRYDARAIARRITTLVRRAAARSGRR